MEIESLTFLLYNFFNELNRKCTFTIFNVHHKSKKKKKKNEEKCFPSLPCCEKVNDIIQMTCF